MRLALTWLLPMTGCGSDDKGRGSTFPSSKTQLQQQGLGGGGWGDKEQEQEEDELRFTVTRPRGQCFSAAQNTVPDFRADWCSGGQGRPLGRRDSIVVLPCTVWAGCGGVAAGALFGLLSELCCDMCYADRGGSAPSSGQT